MRPIRGSRKASGWSRIHSARRSRSIAFVIGVVFFLACVLTAVVWLAPGAAGVARAANTSGQQKVAAFEDVTIGAGESWDNVVVFAGDLLIDGTVENVVVVVGGDLTVGPNARVGTGVNPGDAAIVSVLGDVSIAPGATVIGRTVDVAGSVSDAFDTAITDPVLRPWRAGSVVGWISSTVFLAIAALIAAAIAPRQVAYVRNRVRGHFFSSLGWGALGAIVAVPIVTVLLIVTVIGIILVVPWLAVGLPVMFFFGFAAVGAMVARLILGAKEDKRGTLMAAAVLGVVLLSIVRWIPIAGAIIFGLLLLVGFGATYMSIFAWRRDKRSAGQAGAVQRRPAAPAGAAPGGGQAARYGAREPAGPVVQPPNDGSLEMPPAAGEDIAGQGPSTD